VGLSCIISEINLYISRKSQFFPPPCTLRPLNGFSLQLGIYQRSGSKKNRMMGLLGRERSLAIFSAICIYNTRRWRTGHTYTGRQQRPRLRI